MLTLTDDDHEPQPPKNSSSNDDDDVAVDDDDHFDSGNDYVFGYGSIMNTSTHGPWLSACAGGQVEKLQMEGGTSNTNENNADDDDDDCESAALTGKTGQRTSGKTVVVTHDENIALPSATNTDTVHANSATVPRSSTVLPGAIARIKGTLGYTRRWNFRSNTGFTALGVAKICSSSSSSSSSSDDDVVVVSESDDNKFSGTDINGVLFRVTRSMISGFDRREFGYERVRVDFRDVEVIEMEKAVSAHDDDDCGSMTKEGKDRLFCDCISGVITIGENDRIWLYVPLPEFTAEADENHPLLQSYVDTVMQGCMEWGGENMAREFVLTTGGWSTFFLNDTPSSRRPWLFRKDYDTIDCILREHSNRTHYAERRHPEEFASAFLLKMMRGTWSLPRRNRSFIGRDSELGRIHAFLTENNCGRGGGDVASSLESEGAATAAAGAPSKLLEVAGMGGVGKTQICVEYCYRHFPSYYGLVVWLNAEGAETLVADYRQFLADTTNTNVKDKNTDEVVAEVKARLFRCKVTWLLIFDNLEDWSLLDKFVPRGGVVGGGKGHVLVTTRVLEHHHQPNEKSSVILSCFNPSESVELICRSAGEHNTRGESNVRATLILADRLGHLPLALAMAAAYMHRCDVDCSEYLDRYDSSSLSSSSSTGGGNGRQRLQQQHGSRTKSSLLGHEAGRLPDYPHGVAASLSLSLNAIERENLTAWEMLHLLCWLGSDQITKSLVRSLLSAKILWEERQQHAAAVGCDSSDPVASATGQAASWVLFGPGSRLALLSLGFTFIATGAFAVVSGGGQSGKIRVMVVVGATVLASLSGGAAILGQTGGDAGYGSSSIPERQSENDDRSSRKPSFPTEFSGDVYEQTDLIWKILKSYSLLTVKEGRGSLHRLLSLALRAAQTERSTRLQNIEICITSLRRVWTFKPERVDTWQESVHILEHVKSVIYHSFEEGTAGLLALEAGALSREAGVFSAMALNRFDEARGSLELSLRILGEDGSCSSSGPTKTSSFPLREKDDDYENEAEAHVRSLAESNLELGRVLRYQGKYVESEEALRRSLELRGRLAGSGTTTECEDDEFVVASVRSRRRKRGVADTLHELGVLEVKKHNLESASAYLRQSLELRRWLINWGGGGGEDPSSTVGEGDYAATMHQLAAVHVARKPPSLAKAESLLQEALRLNMQIGQRAATLKQLARVTIRQGLLDRAETYLGQALDLYHELYGERTPHINVAAVKFQQGALASQREQFDRAWAAYSECLRIRRIVYAYAASSPVDPPTVVVSTNPAHLDVSCALHELGRVAFAMHRFEEAREMLTAERDVLECLDNETMSSASSSPASQTDRIFQARLTNLTWLRKCVKEMADDHAESTLAAERSNLKANAKQRRRGHNLGRVLVDHANSITTNDHPATALLQEETLRCRWTARRFALSAASGIGSWGTGNDNDDEEQKLLNRLNLLNERLKKAPKTLFKRAVMRFHDKILECLSSTSDIVMCSKIMLEACDDIRDVLREHGLQVHDTVLPKESN